MKPNRRVYLKFNLKKMNIIVVLIATFCVCAFVSAIPVTSVTQNVQQILKDHNVSDKYQKTLVNTTFLPFLKKCEVKNPGALTQTICESYFEMVIQLSDRNLPDLMSQESVTQIFNEYNDKNVTEKFCTIFGLQISVKPIYLINDRNFHNLILDPKKCQFLCMEFDENVVNTIKPVCKLLSYGYKILSTPAVGNVVKDTVTEKHLPIVPLQGGIETVAVPKPKISKVAQEHNEQVKNIAGEKPDNLHANANEAQEPQQHDAVPQVFDEQLDVVPEVAVEQHEAASQVNVAQHEADPQLVVKPQDVAQRQKLELIDKNEKEPNKDLQNNKNINLVANTEEKLQENHVIAEPKKIMTDKINEFEKTKENKENGEIKNTDTKPENIDHTKNVVVPAAVKQTPAPEKPPNSDAEKVMSEQANEVSLDPNDQDDNDEEEEQKDILDDDMNQPDDEFVNEEPKTKKLPPTRDEFLSSSHRAEIIEDPFFEETDSNFFTYFMCLMLVCILAYVAYHNKTKVLALVLEGRRSNSGRNGIGRRKHTAAYRKLDTNLEEAITSHASGRTAQIIY